VEPWFGNGLEAADDKTPVLVILARVGDLALPLETTSEHRSVSTSEIRHLQSDGGFSAYARILIESMLRGGTPTVDRLASAAGLSVRTFQRKLHAEATSFLMLLDEARHSLSLARFGKGVERAGGIAVGLGYGQQSSLTRRSADGQARLHAPSCAGRTEYQSPAAQFTIARHFFRLDRDQIISTLCPLVK
jgi:AraC-like DNA-binding protein